MKMSETNGNGTMAEHIADGNIEPVMKKARIDESVEERDFDEETQKALEEIDANQNEIDALNEREFCLKLLQNKRGLGISHTRYKVLYVRVCAHVYKFNLASHSLVNMQFSILTPRPCQDTFCS